MDQTNVLQACYGVTLILFVVAVFAGRAVYKLRKTPAPSNPWLLPFAYLSLSSWIFWTFQYLLFLVGPFTSFSSAHLQNTVLWLGAMQNALWASAVLSLHSKQFPSISLTVPLLIMFSILMALVTYLPATSIFDPLTQIDIVSAAAIFTFLAYWIVQLRLSTLLSAVFFIHGYTQWIWKRLWIDPLNSRPVILLLFAGWHITLLVVWIHFISAIPPKTQPLRREGARDGKGLRFSNPLVKISVMIASTMKDLTQERAAAERAVSALRLDSFRAETFGSLADTPQAICSLWAAQCDIFILIIGEEYGYVIESDGKSAVEFEYEIANNQDHGKILVYVKDNVRREAPLERFLERLQDFQHGHVTSSFTTPQDLYKKIQQDVPRWLASYAKST